MYNEELKTKFVKHYTTSINTARMCKTVFNHFEPYEREEWNEDLCTRSAEDLQPIIDNIVGLRSRSRFSRLIMLKDYVKWCMNAQNYPGACDGMLRITTIGLDKVRHQTVASPLHLQKYLNAICQPESEKSADNIYRCYYWLAYGGVAEEDILRIKCSDVDMSNMIVHYKGTEIPIYREAIAAFKNCMELTQFVYNHPNYTETIWKDRAKGDTLIRGYSTNPSLYSIRVELSRRAKKHEEETGLRPSYFRIWISGLFYRAYEMELIGEEPDFSYIVRKQNDEKAYEANNGQNTRGAKKRKDAKDYNEDYQRWKLAFKI